MQIETPLSQLVAADKFIKVDRPPSGIAFPLLSDVTRPTVDTAAAAYYLNRRPQTMRGWACSENGPLRPIRIHGRLAWSVTELRRVLGLPS